MSVIIYKNFMIKETLIVILFIALIIISLKYEPFDYDKQSNEGNNVFRYERVPIVGGRRMFDALTYDFMY